MSEKREDARKAIERALRRLNAGDYESCMYELGCAMSEVGQLRGQGRHRGQSVVGHVSGGSIGIHYGNVTMGGRHE